MQWKALFHKEMLENWRNKKWLWVPLVFILLCLMDPLTYYFLPEIMDTVGNVPEGMQFELPDMTGPEVMMVSVEQLSLFGVLIIILIAMGTITGERKSGITEIILVKPIRPINFITTKWLVYIMIALFSLFIGLLLNWYYSSLLFNAFPFHIFLIVFLFYSVWYIFIVTLVIFYNTFVKTPGLVVASTIATLFIMAGINMAIGHRFTWFPNQLTNHINTFTQTEEISSAFIGTTVIISIVSLLLLFVSVLLFNRK